MAENGNSDDLSALEPKTGKAGDQGTAESIGWTYDYWFEPRRNRFATALTRMYELIDAKAWSTLKPVFDEASGKAVGILYPSTVNRKPVIYRVGFDGTCDRCADARGHRKPSFVKQLSPTGNEVYGPDHKVLPPRQLTDAEIGDCNHGIIARVYEVLPEIMAVQGTNEVSKKVVRHGFAAIARLNDPGESYAKVVGKDTRGQDVWESCNWLDYIGARMDYLAQRAEVRQAIRERNQQSPQEQAELRAKGEKVTAAQAAERYVLQQQKQLDNRRMLVANGTHVWANGEVDGPTVISVEKAEAAPQAVQVVVAASNSDSLAKVIAARKAALDKLRIAMITGEAGLLAGRKARKLAKQIAKLEALQAARS